MILVSDIEYLFVFIFLFYLMYRGLSIREVKFKKRTSGLSISKSMSIAIKGVACIFILLGHYGQRKFDINLPWGISKIIWHTTANIALAWFMFFSGYGLSLRDYSKVSISKDFLDRIKKIYAPLLLTCIVMMMMYALLPDKFSIEQYKNLWIPMDIYRLHNFNIEHVWILLQHSLGWCDWYVFCILIFYAFFYLSVIVSRKYRWNQTIVLSTLMLVYMVIAFSIFGWEKAHWFRFPWAFMLGHIVAVHSKNKWQTNWGVLLLFGLLFIFHGKIQVLCGFVSVALLYIFALIDKHYAMNSKCLLFLGGISYFYYLTHIRIGYVLMVYLGINSIIFWTLFTAMIAFMMSEIYSKILKH